MKSNMTNATFGAEAIFFARNGRAHLAVGAAHGVPTLFLFLRPEGAGEISPRVLARKICRPYGA